MMEVNRSTHQEESMLRIEVKKGFDEKLCCDVLVRVGNWYKEVKVSEPIEELERRKELFLSEYFKRRK